jgi:hypothetical protein
MNRAERLRVIFTLLRALGHDSALVGGFAVIFRTRERFTKDLDIAVAVDNDAEAEEVVFALRKKYSFSLLEVFEHAPTQRLGTVRFGWPDSQGLEPELDLLFASCGIEREVVAASTLEQIGPGQPIPVARLSHLIAMKVLSVSDVRDQDRADLRALIAVASKADLEEARVALELIEERGFHRDKDLGGDLTRLFEEFRS